MFEIINTINVDIKELETVQKLVEFFVKKEKLEKAVFNIIIVNNEEIQKINHQYRHIDQPTDVISFALEDYKDVCLDFRMLGDIYISYDKARGQALEYGHSLLRELSFLTVHGLLHLLGYDHMNKEDEKKMLEKQEMILNEFGISR